MKQTIIHVSLTPEEIAELSKSKRDKRATEAVNLILSGECQSIMEAARKIHQKYIGEIGFNNQNSKILRNDIEKVFKTSPHIENELVKKCLEDRRRNRMRQKN